MTEAKQAGEVARSRIQRDALANGTSSKPATFCPSTVDRGTGVWLRLKQMYGERFVREFGPTPSQPWLAALDELTDEQCGAALTSLRKAASKWVPTLGEFLEHAGKGDGVRYLGVPETAEQKQRRIGHVKASPEVAARHLANMRRRLPATPPEVVTTMAAAAPMQRNPILERGCTCAPDGTGAACECCIEWQRVMREGTT